MRSTYGVGLAVGFLCEAGLRRMSGTIGTVITVGRCGFFKELGDVTVGFDGFF